MNKILLEVVHDVFSENLLVKFKEEIEEGQKVLLEDPPAMGNLDLKLVKDSVFMFS